MHKIVDDRSYFLIGGTIKAAPVGKGFVQRKTVLKGALTFFSSASRMLRLKVVTHAQPINIL